ncbi:hypothetical protein GCM10027456_79070 [Kineosporia babensis]
MVATASASTNPSADELRAEMVSVMVDKGLARSPEVIEALKAVPRHLVKGVDPELVYDPYKAAVTKPGRDGVNLSSVSAAYIQATQLEQAQVEKGHRVLEIGSGGVNAAYLAELVGPAGQVVTMDIDSDVTTRATEFLKSNGYEQVTVLTGDAGFGAQEFAPFDRIVVTVETTDIAEAWWDQLSDDGIIVAPMRWQSQRRSVALVRQTKDTLVADNIAQAGFVPLQGIGEERETVIALLDDAQQRATLRVEDSTLVDAEALTQAIQSDATHVWTGVNLPQEPRFAPLDLWLATLLNTVVLTGTAGAHEAPDIPQPSPIGRPTLVEGSSMAYRTLRPNGSEWELGVIGYGPAASDLAERYAEAIRSWSPQRRPQLTVTRNPSPTPVTTGLASRSVQRRNSTLTIAWS